MAAPSLNIFEFVDYRKLLGDFYDQHKGAIRGFSYRSFAQRAGVSASVLKDVITGRRRLTLDVADKYAAAMKLSPRESEYFRSLVQFVNADTTSEKNEHFAAMNRLRGRLRLTFLDAHQYAFFSQWYHSAVRELVTMPYFREDPAWIAKALKPRITEAQARNSLDLLQRLNLLRRGDSGRLEVTSATISSEAEVRTLALRNFHHEMIRRADEALEAFPVEEREVSSLTLGVSAECYGRIKERVRAFKEELLQMATDDRQPSATVCQVNFQLFPLLDRDADEAAPATGMQV